MEKNQIYYAEVDSEGDLVNEGFVMLEANYVEAVNTKARAIEGKYFKKIDNNPPEIAENQTLNYLGWSQKSEQDGKPISTNWLVQDQNNEQCINNWIRPVRDMLLAECDWTQTNDCPLSTEAKAEWAAYRTALRDITNSFTEENPLISYSQITWPQKPGHSYVEPE
jgi:hypothetical protein